MKEKVFAANEVVFREGDLGECFYDIVSGTAGVYLSYGEPDQNKLTELKAGQFIGEMAVIDSWPRSATVVAEEELKLIEVYESDLNAYFEENPDRILALMKQIGSRIRTLTTEYDEVKEFLREKQEAQEKPGFLSRLRKYQDLNARAKKLTMGSGEMEIKLLEFGRPENSPLTTLTFNRGKVIVRQGDGGSFMYAIHSGEVGIYTNYGTEKQQKLTTLYPGSFFGEMSLLDEEPRSATAIAEMDGTVLEIIRPEDLKELFRVNPIEIDMILQHLSRRLRMLTKDYEKACEEAASV